MKKLLTSIITVLMLTTCFGFNVTAEEYSENEDNVLVEGTESGEELESSSAPVTLSSGLKDIVSATFEFKYGDVELSVPGRIYRNSETNKVEGIIPVGVYDYYFDSLNRSVLDEYIDAMRKGKLHIAFDDDTSDDVSVELKEYEGGFEYIGAKYTFNDGEGDITFDIIIDETRVCTKRLDVVIDGENLSGGFDLFAQYRDYIVDGENHPFDAYMAYYVGSLDDLKEVYINKKPGQEDLVLIEDYNILLPFGDDSALKRYYGYSCVHDGRTSYFLINELPCDDIGVVLYSNGKEFSFTYGDQGKDGEVYYAFNGDLGELDFNDLVVKDTQGNVLELDRNCIIDGDSFTAAKSADGKSYFLITMNEREAYITYGQGKNRIDFHYSDDIDGTKYYVLNYVGNFNISDVVGIRFEGKDYDLSGLTDVKYKGQTYIGKKIENFYLLFTTKVPTVKVEYLDKNDNSILMGFMKSWEDEEYITYCLDTGDFNPNNVSLSDLSKVYVNGELSTYTMTKAAVEYKGMSLDGFVCSFEGFDKRFIFYKDCSPVYPVSAYLEYKGARYDYFYSHTDLESQRDYYWPNCNTNEFNRNDTFVIHYVDGEENVVVNPSYDASTNSIVYKAHINSTNRDVAFFVTEFNSQPQSKYDVVLNYNQIVDNSLQRRIIPFNYNYTDSFGIQLYSANMMNLNDMFRMENVLNVEYTHDGVVEELPIEKHFVNGHLQYTAVIREGEEIKAYLTIYSASVYDKAVIEIFNDEIPLTYTNRGNGNAVWSVYSRGFYGDRVSRVNYFKENFTAAEYKIKYYYNKDDAEPALVQTFNDAVYNNANDIHGYKIPYYAEQTIDGIDYVENGVFALYDGSAGVMPEYSQITAAYLEYNDRTYYFDINSPKTDSNSVTYYLINDDNTDFSSLMNFNGRPCVITAEYKTPKGRSASTTINIYNQSVSQYESFVGNTLYTTKNGNYDYQVKFVVMDTSNRIDNDTIISVDNYKAKCNYNSYENVYRWSVYADPFEMASNGNIQVKVSNIAPDGQKIAPLEAENSPTLIESNDYYLIFELKKNQDNIITFNVLDSQGNPTGVSQKHNLWLTTALQDALDYTYIESVKAVDFRTSLSYGYMSNPNVDKHTYGEIHLFVHIQSNTIYDELIKAIENNDFATATQYEEKVFNISFKNNVKISREYGFSGTDKSPRIVYTLTYNGVSQKVIFDIYKQGGYGAEIIINGNPCRSRVIYTENPNTGRCEEYFVYTSYDTNMSYDEILKLTNYEYHQLYVDVQNYYFYNDTSLESYDKLIYKDGKMLKKNSEIVFKIYDVADAGIEFSTSGIGNSYEVDLSPIVNTDGYSLNERNYSMFGVYEDAAEALADYIKNGPVFALKDEEGNYVPVTLRFDTYEKLTAYEGDEPAYALYIKTVKGDSHPYRIQLAIKQKGIHDFAEFSYFIPQSDGNEPSGAVIDVNSEESLNAAIISLLRSRDCTIRLTDDISLSSNLRFYHPIGTLTVDLNGHNINAAGRYIEVVQGSYINICNTSENDAVLSSTVGESFIRNYGELRLNEYSEDSTTVYGKLIINSNSTAVDCTWNSSIRVYKNVTINAATCLKLVCDTKGTTRVDFMTQGGSDKKIVLNAGDYGVYIDTLAATNYGSSYVDLNYIDVISDNVGIYCKGDINLILRYISVNAKMPLVIGGVDATLMGTNLDSSEASYNENYAYDKPYGEFGFTSNGAAILVDSADSKVGNTTVSIDLAVSKLRAKGALIAETRTNNIGKVQLVEIKDYSFYSLNTIGDVPVLHYYGSDYADLGAEFAGEMIDIVDKTVVNVYSGLFKYDISNFEYIDTEATPVYNAHIWNTVGDTGYKVYYVKPQTNTAEVNTYSELKSALENKVITNIVVDSSISYDSETDGDSNILNVNVSRSGKNIYLNNNAVINGYQFNCNGPLTKNDSYYTLRIHNGSFINNSGPVFVVDGCNFNTERTEISSSGTAIVLEKGTVYLNVSNVSGSSAVVSNVVNTDDYARIYVSGGTVKGTAGPAIELNCSNDNEAIIQLQRNWLDGEGVANVVSLTDSAIKTSGEVRLWLYASAVSGKKGIEMSEAGVSGIHIDADNKIVATEGEAVLMTGTLTNSYLSVQGAELISAGDTVKFSGTGHYEISGVKFKKGKDKLFVNGGSTNNGCISSGYFSDVLTNKEIGYLVNDSTYTYKSVLTNVYEDYPYSLAKSEKTAEENKGISYTNVVLGNSRSVKVETNNAISAAEAYAYKMLNNGQELEMVLNVTETESTFDESLGVKESFEISVTKSGSETTELVNYQTVTMSVSDYTRLNENGQEEAVYSDPNKLVVYHNHDGNTYALKKVSEEDGKLLKEECYYITYDENDVAYVNIVTRQFSEFGFAEADSEIEASVLKDNADLVLNYNGTYSLSEFRQPEYAQVNGYKLMSGEATVVYEGIEGTVFYSENELPTIGGNFKVTWYAKDNNSLNISGSGSAVISIVNDDVSNIEESQCQVYGNSISLEGDIAKNFYIIIDEDVMLDKNAYAELSDGKYSIRQNIVDSSFATNIDGNNVTVGKFTYRVPAKEIYKPITIRLYTGDGKLIKLSHTVNGYTRDVTAGYTSSVGEYLNSMIERSDVKPELYDVCVRMIEYGELAAEYFTGEKAEISNDVLNVEAADLEKYKSADPTSEYVTEHAVSLVLESETTIKHYFRFDLGEYENFDIKVNGKPVVVEQRNDDYGTYYVISIPNISAKNLDETYVVELTHEDGTVLKYEYSALSYVYAQLSNPRDNLLRNLCASIYLYNQAANAYFEMNQR